MKNNLSVCVLTILVYLSQVLITTSINNPGILVTVPFPISPPQIDLVLPIKLDPIIVDSLQLSAIQIKQVDYSWQFTEKSVIVKISDARVIFDWSFKKDHGQGTFQQTSYQLDLGFQFAQNSKNNRLELNILSSKSKLGHSTVHLGGNVQEIVIVQITKLIINHAAITFRKSIQNAIKNAVKSFAGIVGSDIKLYCHPTSQIKGINFGQFDQKSLESQQAQEKCLYANTTLVAPPITNNKDLIIQLNGAVYQTGQSSGYLNPNSSLIRTNSSFIEMQVHQKLFQVIGNKIIELMDASIQVDLSSISSVVTIDSLTLSSVFPKMVQFAKSRNVIMSINIIDISMALNQQSSSLRVQGKLQITVNTLNQKKQKQRYMKDGKATFMVDIQPVFGWKSSSLRIKNINVDQVEFDYSDVQQGFVKPEILLQILPSLIVYLKGGVNGSLNEKLVTLQFNGIRAALKGQIQSQLLRLDLSLQKAKQKQYLIVLND